MTAIPSDSNRGTEISEYMLYDFDYRNPAHPVPLFFRAELNDGVVDVESVEVKS